MQFDEKFEKIFFNLALKDPTYLTQVQSHFYSLPELAALHQVVYNFYHKYTQTPTKEQVKALVENDQQYRDQIDNGIIDSIYTVNLDQYDGDWLSESIETWIKYKELVNSVQDVVEYLKTTKIDTDNCDHVVDKAKEIINQRNNISFNSDLGLDFFNPDDHFQYESEKISSGYQFIDNVTQGGYDIQSLVVYAGEQNVGKSIYLANDAGAFVRRGVNTAVITCEMAPYKFVKRVGANMLNISVNKYGDIAKDSDYIKKKLETVGDGLTPPGNLFFKAFPTSSASVLDLESYLQQLEDKKGIKLGAVVIDYINILSNYRNPNTENTYIKIKQISEDLRAMAQRNDWLIVTATQLGRQAFNSSDLRPEDIAESIGLSHTADFILGIIQDEFMHVGEDEGPYYFLKLLKVRDGTGKGTKCKIRINYEYMRLMETETVI